MRTCRTQRSHATPAGSLAAVLMTNWFPCWPCTPGARSAREGDNRCLPANAAVVAAAAAAAAGGNPKQQREADLVDPVLATLTATEWQGVLVEAPLCELRLLSSIAGGAQRAQTQLEVAPVIAPYLNLKTRPTRLRCTFEAQRAQKPCSCSDAWQRNRQNLDGDRRASLVSLYDLSIRKESTS